MTAAIWKHNEYQYTVRTSRGLYFDVLVKCFLPTVTEINRIQAGEGYTVNGTLIHAIPSFLKRTFFELQKKQS